LLAGAFAFGNVPPGYRCAHSRGDFIKALRLRLPRFQKIP
jgi:hypothetical protein